MNGISALITETPESALGPLTAGDTGRGRSSMNQEALARHRTCIIANFPASRMVRK